MHSIVVLLLEFGCKWTELVVWKPKKKRYDTGYEYGMVLVWIGTWRHEIFFNNNSQHFAMLQSL